MDYDRDAGRTDAGRRRFLKQAGAVALGGLLLGGQGAGKRDPRYAVGRGDT